MKNSTQNSGKSSGPSAQHRAECDCKEFYGGKCIWPECGGMRPEEHRKRHVEEHASIQKLKLKILVVLIIVAFLIHWVHSL